MRTRTVIALLSPLLSAPAFGLQPVPIGPEITVSHTGYDEYFYSDGQVCDARVATAPDGDFVVVWTRAFQNNATYGSAVYGIVGRRYDRTGSPLGGEFQISSLADRGYTMRPGVAVASTGDFIVTWNHDDTLGIQARRYTAAGAALGPQFQVAESQDYGRHTAVALDPDGGALVVWDQYYPGFNQEVFGRRLDPTGTPLGAPFQVDTTTTGWQGYARVSSDPTGNFVVVWNQAYDSDDGVLFQRYDRFGTRLGGEGLALSQNGAEIPPSVSSAADGTFAVVSDFHAGTLARRFDASGVPLWDEFSIGGFYNSVVASDAAGNFLVVGQSLKPGSFDEHIFGRLYDPDGVPQGPAFQVSAHTVDDNYSLDLPSAAAQPNGDFVVAWAHSYDYATRGVYVRRIGVCGNGLPSPGLPCDDGNTIAFDGCSPQCQVETCAACSGEPSSCASISGCGAVCSDAAAIDDKAFLTIKKILAPAGDESITLRGKILAPPLAPGTYNPAVEGAEVAITGNGFLYARATPTPIPPGLVGSGCGVLDGWKVTGRAPNYSYTYKNLTNALPPACTPGSANGLRVVKFKDKLAKDGTLQFQVNLKNASLPPVPGAPVTATIVLGQSPAAGTAGRCARMEFTRGYLTGATARYYP